ncbi:MAG: hypothetical protein IKI75_12060 [Lachnospiraceae bacterium]|nr:hypothetical protein [Lachnospiraceae bacterium]
MRRINMLICAAAAAMTLAACGEEVKEIEKKDDTVALQGSGEESVQQTGSAAEPVSAERYCFEISGVSLTPDMDVATVLGSLGEYSHYEEESCAAQGKAHFYTFADYEINTYPDGSTDRIYYISLKSDNVATAEGVDLSMDKDKVISVYGSDYTENGRMITYEKGGMRLNFVFNDDNTIASIEYLSEVNG